MMEKIQLQKIHHGPWFTSTDIAKKLHNHHSVSVVKTQKKYKTEIRYCPPKSMEKKTVFLLFSDKPNSVNLPEIINFYNKTFDKFVQDVSQSPRLSWI